MTGRIQVVGAAIVRADRCLVARRGPHMSAPLRWEFPGGKLEPGESAEVALAREIHEELGVVIEVGAWLGRGVAGGVQLDVHLARLVLGEPVAHEHAELAWLGPAQLDALDWADADVPIVARVAEALSRQ